MNPNLLKHAIRVTVLVLLLVWAVICIDLSLTYPPPDTPVMHLF